jgi:hypothetical protein
MESRRLSRLLEQNCADSRTRSRDRGDIVLLGQAGHLMRPGRRTRFGSAKR